MSDFKLGDVSYFEAINQETLGNAMLRLKEMGMINVFDGPKPPSERFSGTGSRWICLSAAWTPTERLPELAYSDIETHLKRKKKDHSENPWSELNMTQVSKDSVPDDFGFQNWYRIRPKGRLWDFCEAIGRFRREGKNRRDTSTVATRVLRLARHAEEYGEKPKARKQLASTKSDHKL